MTLTRRRFLGQTAPLGLVPFLPACGFEAQVSREALPVRAAENSRFQHGVASGDPLSDAVILWTRVTPAPGDAAELEVSWRMARDPALIEIVAEGIINTDASQDFTVKVDADGLEAGTHYYYDFGALGERSPVGRTRTAPTGLVSHARLAVTSCANYPAGFFNAYRRIAERGDIDFVLHLGDYLYEYPNGVLGDGASIGRLPDPDREIVTLEEYRERHAQYKRDPDLQEVHRQYPFVAIWDDHEVANNAYRDGATNHQPDSEGDWAARKADAMRAYFEWMPIRAREPGNSERIYRQFAWGDLFDLVLLDTRFAGRDARIDGNCDLPGLLDPARSILGDEQEAWLLDALQASSARGTHWRLLGQQVMFGQLSDVAEGCVTRPDHWDGYPESRARVLDGIRQRAIDNVVILTGDAHSSWAFDIADNPFDAVSYNAATGDGSLAVEFVTPGVSSPGEGGVVEQLLPTHPHLKFAELTRQGYVLLDVTLERTQAEWYFMTTVRERLTTEAFAAAFRTSSGANRLQSVNEPSPPGIALPPAP